MIKKYEHYKDSGVEWLGEIPEHWEVVRLKNVIRLGITDGPHETPEFIENGVPFLSVDSIQNGELVFDKCRFISEEDHLKYKKKCFVEKNDILMGKAASIGKIAQSKVDFEYSIWSPLALIKPSKEKIISTYLEFYLKSSYSQYQIEILCTSNTQKNISMGDIPKIQISLPPLPEQTAIANFLDDKTVKIDQAIGIKEQQIALLKERKQILIHKAVTRGLDDTVKLKDSGVEWIGEIPVGWEVKKLKYILNGKLKYGANESGIEYDVELPRYVRITDFGMDGKLSEENKLSLSWNNGKDYLLKDGDILFARSGATVGKTYQFKKSMSVESNYCYAGYLIKAEANEEMILSDFLYLYTISELFNKWKDSIFIKATIENIGADKYSQLFVIVPPIEIQKEILFKYETDSKKIDTAISLKAQEIEKLKEYKSSLINSVVTGKVKIIEN